MTALTDRPPGRRRRLQPADHRAAVPQPSHRRLPPAESLHQARHQLPQPAPSRAPRPARRSTAGHAAGLIPGPIRAPRRQPQRGRLSTRYPPSATTIRTCGRAPARAEPSVDVISQPSVRHGGRDVRGAIPRVARQQREACVSISRDARNGPHQTTSQHAWRTEQTGGHVGRTSFSQVEKACSHIPQKSFAPTKRTRTQSSRYCPPASRTTLSADGYSQMTMPGNGCIRSFSAPLFK